MDSYNRDIMFLVLQSLEETNMKETARILERESGCFFNMKYFEALVYTAKLDEAEKYLLGFTTPHKNAHSTKIFFELRKQKYLEALDRNDRIKAADILRNDLKVFSMYNDSLVKEISSLLPMDDFRKHPTLTNYRDVTTQRIYMMNDVRKLILEDPAFQGKLHFPMLNPSSLLTILKKFDGEASTSGKN